jgi:hypothetical protein
MWTTPVEALSTVVGTRAIRARRLHLPPGPRIPRARWSARWAGLGRRLLPTPPIAHAFRDRRRALVTAEVLQHVGGDHWTWTAPKAVDGSGACRQQRPTRPFVPGGRRATGTPVVVHVRSCCRGCLGRAPLTGMPDQFRRFLQLGGREGGRREGGGTTGETAARSTHSSRVIIGRFQPPQVTNDQRHARPEGTNDGRHAGPGATDDHISVAVAAAVVVGAGGLRLGRCRAGRGDGVPGQGRAAE